MTSSREPANRAAWARYFVGRGLQIVGLVLVTRAVFMSSGSQLRAMVALTGVGGTLFLAGWLLARKDPEAR